MKTKPFRLSSFNYPFKTYRDKLCCTAVLLTLPANLVWIMFLAAAIIVSHLTSANGATGSFDRDMYLPSLNDTNDYDRAWISVTDSSGNVTSGQDTIIVTAKIGANSTSFVLKETGGTTMTFTTTGNTRPSQTGIGAKTGYVEDYSGNHNSPALGTSIVGLNLKKLVANISGDATTGADASLTVAAGNTLELVYGGSTLDQALIGFNGANDYSITFAKGSEWGNTISGSVSNASANILVRVNDPDENINPSIKDVIGFQDGFSLGLTNTGSSRVQIEAIDQTTGSLLNLNGVNVITRNIALVETGRSTGIFEASGKVYGADTVTSTGNITVGSQKGYSGDFIELGSPSSAPYVKFRVIETNAATGSLGLFYSGTSTYASVLGFTTGGDFTGLGVNNWSPTKVVAVGKNTTVFGIPTTDNIGTSIGGLQKLIDGYSYCLVQIDTFATTNSAPTSGSTPGTTYETGVGGSIAVTIESFVLTGPQGGDTIKVSYLDELTASGVVGTITAKTTFGTGTTPTPTPTPSDTTAPSGSISINSGASYTNSSTVTLTLSATDSTGVTGYYLSDNSSTPSTSASGWTSVTSTTSYSATVSYSLSGGEGSKTVYVWYKDEAENVSDTASDSITLDTTVPTVTISSPTSDETYTTTNSTISLDGNATDSTSGINSVKWSNSNGESGMASGTTNWSISSINLSSGDSMITVIATDNAGNTGKDTVTVTYTGQTSTPTPSPKVTPTSSVCEPESVELSSGKLILKRRAKSEVAIAVLGENACPVENETIYVEVNASGKRRVSVTPSYQVTNENGEAVFTITAKNKVGNARVTFKAGTLEKSMTVMVRK